MAVWFTVRVADRPGSLARLAGALGDRGVNITGIVGVAEDTDGQLMLTTSDPVATREVLAAIAQEYEERQAPSEQPADLQSSA
ncbi:MAG TPA: ACT domain-containing protein [Candidatus Limnocylindrales bacterium]|nr:ACT domain-containing protein [Candidatus Limnocylindrales bacterium]